MGVDLSGRGGSFGCNWSYWRSCLTIAVAFGWDPAGTIAPTDWDHRTPWDGSYFINSFQEVSDEDARSLAEALDRAAGALANGDPLTNEQKEALYPVPDPFWETAAGVAMLEKLDAARKASGRSSKLDDPDWFIELADFARKGSFVIW
jgi:hypothetical protein